MEKLFAGKSSPFGGLSNEAELVKECPAEFMKDNKWSSFASKIFFNGAHTENWDWKTTDKDEAIKQFICLRGLLGTFGIKHEDKEAVAGWMLSEMLNEIPKD
jgi:hypothetical protein